MRLELGAGNRGLVWLVVDQRALEHVHRADEVGDETGGRKLVEVGRRAELGDRSLVHDRDARGDGQRFVLVVGDHDEGDADFALELRQLEAHGLAQFGIEGGERLVEQEHLRLFDERTRERNALALAA